jgi:membrane fusion protein, adhesin transport system
MAATAATFDLDRPPSAQALIDGPPSSVAGLLIATIAALVGALIGWLAWAQVEEVVKATGRVEPQGRVKVVNHPRGGRIAAVHVRDGDRVEAGQPLVTFAAEIASSERAELLGRWQVRAVEAARLEAEGAGGPTLAVEPALAQARPDLVAAAGAMLAARLDALASRRESAAKQAQARRAELDTAAAEVGRLRNRVTLARQERAAVRELAARGLYPNLKLLAVERQTGDAEGDLAKAEAALSAAKAALAEAQSRLTGVDRDWRSALLGDLAQATAERDRLAEQLRAQTTLVEETVLKAPAAGVVQDLAVTGPGQAVGATEPLMKVVPLGDGLVVEARVANEDIGRLAVGMPAQVKVRAFDYLRFGTLEGTVRRVAADATPDPRTGALAYAVTVATDREHLGALPGDLDVAPGMVVDVELKVGERTILSYLTDRILTFGEAFREG